MPDFQNGEFVVAESPPSSGGATNRAEAEMRKSFSDMLGGVDGMDSFMASVGNFMSDEEFFELKEMDVFKEMYEEYQKTPATKKEQEASRLFESFSDLMSKKRQFSPKGTKNMTKGDERLASMRNELKLDEIEDDEERTVETSQSPDSVAQESTISDVSAYQRGIKLSRLGANPL